MILGLRWRVSENKSAAYEELLTGQVAAALLARGISGLRDLTVWRRDPAELSGAGVWWGGAGYTWRSTDLFTRRDA
jgi:hypothetical protein